MADQYGELVGCDNMHSAAVTADTSAAYTTGTNDYLAPVAEIQHEAKIDTANRYYDNKLRFVTNTEGATEVKITVSGVPCSMAAEYTGKPYDSSKGVFIDTGDASNTPWRTLSGRMDLGDGGYRYFQYLKGKFAIGTQSAQTREDKTNVKTVDLTYTAVITEYKFTMPDSTTKGVKGVFADTTDSAFVTGDSWFSQVQTPATIGAPAALTMSSIVPASGATGVLASANVVLTFSNAIASHSVKLVDDVTDAIVPAAYTFDSTGKILTINPTGNMTAGDKHAVAIFGVKDVYGQSLADSLSYFTVAS